MPELADRPGHIPGMLNLVWQELVDGSAGCLKPAVELQALLSVRQATPQMPVIAYCRCGTRASVGCLPLKRLGCQVRLYDGSYLERMNGSCRWNTRATLLAERVGLTRQTGRRGLLLPAVGPV